jgi:hypothetical protein
MNEACIHELAPATCVLCNGRVPAGRRRIAEPPEAVIRSKFDGRCDRCDSTIREGETIGLFQGSWIHLSHFEDEDL